MTQMTRSLALIAAQSSSDGHTHKVLVITCNADDSVTEKLSSIAASRLPSGVDRYLVCSYA
jgi:hypothetical protein